MNAVKKARVDAVRAETAYPAYRAAIGIITVIMMILAGLQALGSIILGFAAGNAANNPLAGFFVVLIGIAFAVLTFFLARIWHEGAQILVDIGDSTLDANAKTASYAAPAMPLMAAQTTAPPTY